MPTFEGAANWAWDNRKSIQAGLRVLRKWLSSDGRPILVLGAGGTGKSTFGHVLSGQSQGLFERLAEYDQSHVEELLTIGKAGAEILILPGQRHRWETTWPRFLDGLQNGSFRGILLFGAYGFHALGEIRYREMEQYEVGMTKSQLVRVYIESKRRHEVELLSSVSDVIKRAKKPLWLLNVVTKQDLWWNRRAEVRDWYERGPASQVLQGIQNSRGNGGFSLRDRVYFTSDQKLRHW